MTGISQFGSFAGVVSYRNEEKEVYYRGENLILINKLYTSLENWPLPVGSHYFHAWCPL